MFDFLRLDKTLARMDELLLRLVLEIIHVKYVRFLITKMVSDCIQIEKLYSFCYFSSINSLISRDETIKLLCTAGKKRIREKSQQVLQ